MDSWVFEFSSGHAGWQNTKTGEWVYDCDFHRIQQVKVKKLAINNKFYVAAVNPISNFVYLNADDGQLHPIMESRYGTYFNSKADAIEAIEKFGYVRIGN